MATPGSDRLRVGIDATGWLNRRGAGRFARNVISELVELSETDCVLYIDQESAARAELPDRATVRRVSVRRAPNDAAAASSNRSVVDLLRMTRAVAGDRLDAFVFPSVTTYFPVLRVPTVVGVHDTIATDFPELAVGGRRAQTMWRLKEGAAIRRADRLFTLSEASRAALAQRLSLPRERIAVVRPAPAAAFHARSDEEIREARAATGLGDDAFVVFAGGISPHKNVGVLVRACAQLATRPRPKLVLVGALDDTYISAVDEIRRLVDALGVADDVVLPGFVSDETLAALYAGATVVALPSLAEGFGLPAAEAAACHATLAVSDIPAHRELLGDGVEYFPPADVDLLTRALERLLGDADLRRANSELAAAAVADLSWRAAAEQLDSVIADACATRRAA